MVDAALQALDFITHELMLFACIGLLIGGIDDLAIDCIWLADVLRAWIGGRRRTGAPSIDALPAPQSPGRIAILIPAWDEQDVIGSMLRSAVDRIRHDDYRIYVGVYPNDPATIAAARTVNSPHIRIVSGTLYGPTTKAECLNRCWRAVLEDEARDGMRVKAIVLHDAEDVIHPLELALFDRLIETSDLVQIPVFPLADPRSPWISGHYIDEFAESHGKQMLVRERLGAGMPLAGVGCAISRDAMAALADVRGGDPFDAASLTEDYEMGLRLNALGRSARFARIAGRPGGSPIATRAYFPNTLDAAVRQKTRWMIGIALAGWEKLGWTGDLAEGWMRMRDRRSVLAAIVLTAAYAGMLCASIQWLLGQPMRGGAALQALLGFNSALLVWRMVMRAGFVAHAYGVRQGLLSVPRLFVGNLIAIASARRAVFAYARGPVAWDKTSHAFPAELPAE
ncbi:glycosyl transferase family protein [Sphingomonas montanisoli]|uniref:Glycosyl transferase family protein n=1 Tax=Sphingomonas montanisoli TaxID=2606412 RepID=A0A5D9C8A7_9SPHN|nr:glycosyl transferase family protein [Sphingomonas montanisoli]